MCILGGSGNPNHKQVCHAGPHLSAPRERSFLQGAGNSPSQEQSFERDPKTTARLWGSSPEALLFLQPLAKEPPAEGPLEEWSWFAVLWAQRGSFWFQDPGIPLSPGELAHFLWTNCETKQSRLRERRRKMTLLLAFYGAMWPAEDSGAGGGVFPQYADCFSSRPSSALLLQVLEREGRHS